MVSKKYSQLLSTTEQREVAAPKETAKASEEELDSKLAAKRQQRAAMWPTMPSRRDLGFWEEMIADVRNVATNELPNKTSVKKDMSILKSWIQGKHELGTGPSDVDDVMLDLDYHVTPRVANCESFSASVEKKYKTVSPSFSTAGSTTVDQDTVTSSQMEDNKIAKEARDRANRKSVDNESTVASSEAESRVGSEAESKAETELLSIALSSSTRGSRKSSESKRFQLSPRASKMSAADRDAAAARRAKNFMMKGVASSESVSEEEDTDCETGNSESDGDDEASSATEVTNVDGMDEKSTVSSVAGSTASAASKETEIETSSKSTGSGQATEAICTGEEEKEESVAPSVTESATKLPVLAELMKEEEHVQEENVAAPVTKSATKLSIVVESMKEEEGTQDMLTSPVKDNGTKVSGSAKQSKKKKGWLSPKRWNKHAK